MKRRGFLKMIGIGGVGAAVAAVSGNEVVEATTPQPVATEPSLETTFGLLNTLYSGGSVIYNIPSDFYRSLQHGTATHEHDFGGAK